MSCFISPQLLTPARQLPIGDNWRYELKYDGYRAQIHVGAAGVRILTRTGLDWSNRFPDLTRELATVVRVPSILDGEVYARDSQGRPDFTLLCNQLHGTGSVQFAAFDVLEVDGRGTVHLPLRERRNCLAAILSPSAAVHLVEQATDPTPLLAFARQHAWEGLVAKTDGSPYQPGLRSTEWRKLKLKQRQEFVIAGWRPDPHTGAIKSLVLATVENGELTLRGSVGTGFTLHQRRELPSCFTVTRSPGNSRNRQGFVPIEPELVAEIEYLEISSHGIVRQPTFVGLRHDRLPADVSLEGPAPLTGKR